MWWKTTHLERTINKKVFFFIYTLSDLSITQTYYSKYTQKENDFYTKWLDQHVLFSDCAMFIEFHHLQSTVRIVFIWLKSV